MTYAADLHLHSSFARATSPSLDLPLMTRWARVKGIDLIAASDFTHPTWLDRLERSLVSTGDGLFRLESDQSTGSSNQSGDDATPKIILGTEISCIYPQGGRSHRVHLLLFAPDFATAHRLCDALAPYGSLRADGRPILKLSSRDLLAKALETNPRCEIIPAHAWTPWYSLYGSKGGFESIDECFGDLAAHVHAIETGLSSDPSMNWRVPELDGRAIVSFSDAHSAPRMGRELTIFAGEPSYDGFLQALRKDPGVQDAGGQTPGIDHTIEFYPQEGKYHYDGHRKCDVRQHPAVTLERGDRCPVCGRELTVGVLNRMETLARRPASVVQRDDGAYVDPAGRRPPFRRLVPLDEIIAEALDRGPATKGVRSLYDRLIASLGPELTILESTTADAIAAIDHPSAERIADGVVRARLGNIDVQPGYDGVYGTVRLWPGA